MGKRGHTKKVNRKKRLSIRRFISIRNERINSLEEYIACRGVPTPEEILEEGWTPEELADAEISDEDIKDYEADIAYLKSKIERISKYGKAWTPEEIKSKKKKKALRTYYHAEEAAKNDPQAAKPVLKRI